MNEFSKLKKDEADYINGKRNERAQAVAMRVEQAKRAQKRTNIQVKRKADAKDASAIDRNN